MLFRKRKWTDADHTNAPWTTRTATNIPPERFRWITNEGDDPFHDVELFHEWPMPTKDKARRRERYHDDLRHQFGGIDIRTPAYDLNGKMLEGMHAVFVLTPSEEPEPHVQT